MLKLVLSIFLSASTAQAFPIKKKAPVQWPPSFTANHNFEAIVALSNCSGGVFRLENSQDSDKALVLTNGHCLESGFLAPGEATYNIPSSRRFQLLSSAARAVGTLNAQKLVYATMTKTDMAIYELRETYGEIKSRYNTSPLVLLSKPSTINDSIEILSGYWKRGYACQVEAIVTKLKEDDWICEDSIRFSRPGCETIGGTSGSPVILAGTRNIIGVNNTGNEDGERCSESNPCEIDNNGNVTYQKGWSYAQQTYWVYACLNTNRQFDIFMPGCGLPK